ncbi:hypothetical protein NKH77_01845 [Streptomyces sp. M19]
MPLQLELYGADEFRVVVPEREHSGTCEKVDENIAVDIADETAVGVLDSDRKMAWIGAGVGLSGLLPGE